MTSWLDVLCDFVQMQLHRLDVAPGQDRADRLALSGQITPKMSVEAVRWSLGAEGLVPRLAQRRVILFLCPIRASSANQISMREDRRPCRARFLPGAPGSFFKILDRVRRLRVMLWPRRQLAIVHSPQLPAHRLDRDDDAVFLEHPLAEVDKPPTHDAMHGGKSGHPRPCEPTLRGARLSGAASAPGPCRQ